MNKALLLVFTFLSLTTVATAQISKGAVLIGPNLSFSASTSNDTAYQIKQSNFHVSPSVGFATKENTVAGVRLYLGRHRVRYSASTPDFKATLYGAGFFMRRYLPLVKAVYLFGDGELFGNASTGKQKNNDYENTTKEARAGLSFYPGISYAVSKRFQLEAGLSNLLAIEYKTLKSEIVYSTGTTAITDHRGFSASTFVGGSTNFTLGFRFVF